MSTPSSLLDWLRLASICSATVLIGCNDDAQRRASAADQGSGPRRSNGTGSSVGDARAVDGERDGAAPSGSGAEDGERDADENAERGPERSQDAGPQARDAADGSTGDVPVLGARLSPDDVDPAIHAPIEAGTALCNFGSSWSPLTPVSEVESTTFDQLHAVSSDGQSWLGAVRRADEGGGAERDAGTLDAGLRDATIDEDGRFDTFILDLPDTLTRIELPVDYDLGRGAALSPNGRKLIAVLEVPNLLAVFERGGRDTHFGEPDSAPFLRLQNAAIPTGYQYDTPVLSASGDSLYLSLRFRQQHEIRQYARTDGIYNTSWVLTDLQELLDNPQHTRLTSAAADERTVFLWDASQRRALMAGRNQFGEPSGEIVPLAIDSPVFVDAACTRLFALDEHGHPAVSMRED